MTPQRRKLLILVSALVTAGLLWWAPKDAELSEPAKRAKTAPRAPDTAVASSTEAMPGAPLSSGEARAPLTPGDPLFASSSWVLPPPPPPPPAAPPPPPAPTAPPLPYVFMGRFEQDGSQLVILTRNNRVVTAAQGDVLEKTYRIDRIEASKVTLTYLPLGSTQFLPTGSAQ